MGDHHGVTEGTEGEKRLQIGRARPVCQLQSALCALQSCPLSANPVNTRKAFPVSVELDLDMPDLHVEAPGSCPLKEVIHPHLPVRVPCYDLVPLTPLTFGRSLPYGLGHGLRVKTIRVT